MNFVKKLKFKMFLKKRWYVILGAATLPTIALVVGLVGFSINGWSIVRWLQSRFAVAFFVCLIFGILFLAAFIYYWFRFKILEK